MNPDDPMAQWRNRLLGASRGITNGLLGASRAIASGARGLGREFASDPTQAYQDFLRGGASSALNLARFMPGESGLERGLLSAAEKVGPEQRSAHSLLGGFVGDVVPDIMNADAIVAPGRIAEAEGPFMKALEASAFLPLVPGGLLGRAMRRVDDLPEAGGLLRMGDSTPARVPGQVDTGMSGTWYSRLESAIENAPQSRATGDQWSGMIRKAKGGVSGSELEWTGVEDLLSARGNDVLTRDEVMGMARENPIRLTETVRGNSNLPPEVRGQTTEQLLAHQQRLERFAQEAQARGNVDEARELFNRADEFTQFAEASDGLSAGAPKFAQYTQGKFGTRPESNYREVLVQLDDSADQASIADEYHRLVDQGVPLMEAHRRAGTGPGSQFTSSHFDEPNVLTHLRLTDRDVAGDKTLFLEEIQSDWHQKGREKGYRGAPRGFVAVNQRDGREVSRVFRTREEAERASSEFAVQFPDQSPVVRPGELAGDVDTPGVPDAPYKGTDEWVTLAFRRALQEAAEGGYDRLAWVSGEQAADLYDLRKQVSRIEWHEESGGLQAFGLDGEHVLSERNVSADQLADFIGKEPARRLVEQVPARPTEGGPSMPAWRSIEGDDLAVGGEGMNTFYDRIVPNVVKKEARRLGVEIEPVQVTKPGFGDPRDMPTNLSIRITPEARRKILKEGTKLAGFGGIGLLGANFARQQRERAAEQNNSRGLLN